MLLGLSTVHLVYGCGAWLRSSRIKKQGPCWHLSLQAGWNQRYIMLPLMVTVAAVVQGQGGLHAATLLLIHTAV